ncbi:MAG: hypothetical protein HND42_08880 [Armatimonadetes bacterium]|nr:MAG: hypothetical protein EDM73_07540 [Armatimonadota bacterium]MCE7900253.1 hypothetical protein [Armatimonadetes bacterium ATM1]MDL1928409.1 hypothetical protein [Fimbriimonadia bacterium ATM]MBC6969973.1 hypothetical protein [Armatimonadota bacterium]MBL1150304.1 hypothetical protein [Armatimonadota bacterium]
MKISITLVLLIGLATVIALAMAPRPNADGCCGGKSMQHDEHNQKATTEDKPVPAKIVEGVQRATVVIDRGYKPSSISVRPGLPVELTFKLGANPGCGDVLVIKDLKYKKKLQAGKPEVVKFTPKKVGEMIFECGMGMLKGKVVITNE